MLASEEHRWTHAIQLSRDLVRRDKHRSRYLYLTLKLFSFEQKEIRRNKEKGLTSILHVLGTYESA